MNDEVFTLNTVLWTCEHCGADVAPARLEGEPHPRNHCPECLWSKHVNIGGQATGGAGYEPCGGMMKPFDKGSHRVLWRCLGCGFMMEAATDDYMMAACEQTGAYGVSALPGCGATFYRKQF